MNERANSYNFNWMNWTSWNRIRYTLYTPIYNVIRPAFDRARATSISALHLKDGDHVLIVGGGTGLDLPYIPSNVRLTFTDITPAMVAKAKRAKLAEGVEVEFKVADGSDLPYSDTHFDAVILHLIVAVLPDPQGCIDECNRVLIKGGRIAIMDKFRESFKPSLGRKILNPVIKLFFTSINRRVEDYLPNNWELLSDEGVLLGRTFRSIQLKKL